MPVLGQCSASERRATAKLCWGLKESIWSWGELTVVLPPARPEKLYLLAHPEGVRSSLRDRFVFMGLPLIGTHMLAHMVNLFIYVEKYNYYLEKKIRILQYFVERSTWEAKLQSRVSLAIKESEGRVLDG